MKVVFLDIDGVLCLSRRKRNMKASSVIDSGCLNSLKLIINSTKALIVLSSSWRMFKESVQMLEELFKIEEIYGFYQSPSSSSSSSLNENTNSDNSNNEQEEDFNIGFYDKTPILSTRRQEIIQYIKNNQNDINNWVALDDIDLVEDIKNIYDLGPYEIKNHFVKVDASIGLTEEDAYKAIEILNFLK
eukprot:TRINITY_DN1294_c0_g1_i2.p1 TRINITY_DN1294_c0_g1~~TRINITY_DN1294_c0_g1_i2.p1  ORF type:complete len:188 (-),score=50.75 TRINITY_DN1294_c0_g1_i2:96-659(-)